MSVTAETHSPTLPRSALAFAALGPVAIGGILALRSETLAPLIAVPAVIFGVVAATSPALYIATAATGTAPPLSSVLRAFATALGAFGIALAGLLLPASFLSLSTVDTFMTFAVASAAVGAAAFLGLRRLSRELASWTPDPTFPHATVLKPSLSSSTVFFVWSVATFGIASRLWWDLAKEVLS
jgi:hypothetical protein